MADEADVANDFIDTEVTRALGRLRQAGEIKQGPKACVECDEAIPLARRKLGFKFCVECAEEIERRKSLFAN